MKKVILFCLFLLFFFGCKTTETNYSLYTRESYIAPGRHVINSADGGVQGYLEQSNIDPDRTVQYDKNGKPVGYWKKSPIDTRKTLFYKK